MDRIIKSRTEYRLKITKDQLDYKKMLDEEELNQDIVCPKCGGEKELVMTPYWGWGRTYYTCYFICSKCD